VWRRPAVLFGLSALWAFAACTSSDLPTADVPLPTAVAANATVERVVDGDTVVVRLGRRRELVRLIGIDTPETVDRRQPVQCFGHEASARTAALLPPGTPVRLERDAEARDRYGRLLAYVRRATDDLFVNHDLVLSGHAAVLRIEPNTAHADLLAAAMHGARADRRGLWGACGALGVPAAQASPAGAGR
jgi:micrococcal nuclease